MQIIQDRLEISAWQAGSHTTLQEIVRYRPNDFLPAGRGYTNAQRYTCQLQIKHVIYAGHAWHQRERGRRTANLDTVATLTLVP